MKRTGLWINDRRPKPPVRLEDDYGSRRLFLDLDKQGYNVLPVNPNAEEIEGRACFARLQDIKPAIDGALLITTPAVTERVVRDCAEAGIGRVWMQSGVGIGSVSPAAVQLCKEKDIKVIPGFCPYMFLANTPISHHIHGFFLKLLVRYPK